MSQDLHATLLAQASQRGFHDLDEFFSSVAADSSSNGQADSSASIPTSFGADVDDVSDLDSSMHQALPRNALRFKQPSFYRRSSMISSSSSFSSSSGVAASAALAQSYNAAPSTTPYQAFGSTPVNPSSPSSSSSSPSQVAPSILPQPEPQEAPATRSTLSRYWNLFTYYVPLFSWLFVYEPREMLFSDIAAGLSVGVVLVPSGLIYASLANLPPVHGLLAAIVPVLVYFVMGSSRHLSIGPEITTAILIGKCCVVAAAARLPADADITDPAIQTEYYVPVAMALSFLIGLCSLLLGVFRLGFLDSILSRPILSGFINAIAITLMSEQTPFLLGLTHVGGASSSPAEALWFSITHIMDMQLGTTALAVGCCVALLTMRSIKGNNKSDRFIQTIPDVLLVILVGTGLSYVLDLKSKGVAVLVIGETGFSAPKLPALGDMFSNSFLFTNALTISLLGFVESQLVSKRMASKYNYSVSANRELVALGAANLVGSLFGAFCAFGSIARTKVAESAGAVSNVTNLVAASVAILSLLFTLPMFAYTPRAVTSSIIFVVALSLLETHDAKFMYAVQAYRDLALMVAMTLITYFLGIDIGLVFAFSSCLLMAVKRTTLPSVALLGRDSSSDDAFASISDVHDKKGSGIQGVLIYSLRGALYFANAERLRDSTRKMELYGSFHFDLDQDAKPLEVTTIILDLESLSSIDVSALQVLLEICIHYRQEKKRVCLVSMPKKILYKLALAGILETVGFDNLFKTLNECLSAVQADNKSGSATPHNSHPAIDDHSNGNINNHNVSVIDNI